MKLFRQSVLLLLCLVFATSVFASESGVRAAYDAWTTAISKAGSDPTGVVKLYTPDAILLATFADKVKFNDKNQLDSYFKSFTDRKDLSVTTQEFETQKLADNIVVATGFYTFSFVDKDDEKVALPARFTFVFKDEDGKWLIANQHSSLSPTHKE